MVDAALQQHRGSNSVATTKRLRVIPRNTKLITGVKRMCGGAAKRKLVAKAAAQMARKRNRSCDNHSEQKKWRREKIEKLPAV